MLKHADETHEGERPDIRTLLERLATEGRSWAEAELALARIELSELRAKAVKALVSAALAFAFVFSALVVLSQAGIAFLTPYVDGEGVAALIVGGVLLLLVAVSVLVMRSALAWRTESVFLRWFTRRTSGDAKS